jgi:hypothetical protein
VIVPPSLDRLAVAAVVPVVPRRPLLLLLLPPSPWGSGIFGLKLREPLPDSRPRRRVSCVRRVTVVATALPSAGVGRVGQAVELDGGAIRQFLEIRMSRFCCLRQDDFFIFFSFSFFFAFFCLFHNYQQRTTTLYLAYSYFTTTPKEHSILLPLLPFYAHLLYEVQTIPFLFS